MNDFLAADNIYTVNCHTQLNSFDRKVLTTLYQPIIGHSATALYFTLWSEVEIDRIYSSPAYIKRLIKIMNIDLQSLVHCFNVLESLGLVQTLYRKNKESDFYHIKIFSPEQPSTFFQNPLLTSNLKNALDSEDYNKTKMFFALNETDETIYENISKKYQDVFSMNYDLRILNGKDTYKEYNYAKIASDVDFSLIKEALKNYNLQNLINESKVKKTIEMLLLTYPMTTNDIVESIVECSENNTIDLNELIKSIEMKDKIRKHKTELDLVYLRNDNATNKYEKNSVFDYLKKYCNSLKIDKDLLINLENIMKDYTMSNGVFNVLVEYVVKKNGTINLNYLKAIANSWNIDGINTVELALQRIDLINKNDNNNKRKNNYSKKKVIGNADDWYQIADKNEMSDEESKYIDSILSDLEKR
ncbi:replication initiation and membrane attachment protein [Bacilli bacterium PM5-9]|nr:replication initiation and membrane attachment protein [Bacilli bacterium PM5-9]